MMEEREEMFVGTRLGFKTDGYLIYLKWYPNFKADNIILTIEDIERIAEITRARAKMEATLINDKSKTEPREI